MHLSEKDLIHSFDSEEDFIQYIGRKPLLDFEETQRTMNGEGRIKSVEDIEKRKKDIDSKDNPKKPKMSIGKIKERVKELDEALEDDED